MARTSLRAILLWASQAAAAAEKAKESAAATAQVVKDALQRTEKAERIAETEAAQLAATATEAKAKKGAAQKPSKKVVLDEPSEMEQLLTLPYVETEAIDDSVGCYAWTGAPPAMIPARLTASWRAILPRPFADGFCLLFCPEASGAAAKADAQREHGGHPVPAVARAGNQLPEEPQAAVCSSQAGEDRVSQPFCCHSKGSAAGLHLGPRAWEGTGASGCPADLSPTSEALAPALGHQGFLEWLKRPDNRPILLSEFQRAFDAIDGDVRKKQEVIAELLLRADELRDALWDVCDQRLQENEEEHKAIAKDSYVADHANITTAQVQALLQVELDRFYATVGLAQAYSCAQHGIHQPTESRRLVRSQDLSVDQPPPRLEGFFNTKAPYSWPEWIAELEGPHPKLCKAVQILWGLVIQEARADPLPGLPGSVAPEEEDQPGELPPGCTPCRPPCLMNRAALCRHKRQEKGGHKRARRDGGLQVQRGGRWRGSRACQEHGVPGG